MYSIGRLSLLAIIAWIALLLYISSVVYSTGRHDNLDQPEPGDEQALKRLARAVEDVEALRKQNNELKSLLENKGISVPRVVQRPDASNYHVEQGGQGRVHEEVRRSAENGVVELWYFVTSALNKLKQNIGQDKVQEVDRLLTDGSAQKRAILADLFKLSEADDAGRWRAQAMKNLSDLVQQRLHALQNPKDCTNAKKLLCHLNKGCGYGCQVHHAAYCLIVAYATQRTMILNSSGWRYSSKGWESVFLPVSESCTSMGAENPQNWQDEQAQRDTKVVSLPIIDSVHPRPPYLPLSFPEDLAERLIHLHGAPPAWWIGQIVRYLLRPQPELQKELDDLSAKMGFANPIVGLHVRRTDKVGSEAAFHSIEEYMVWAEEYFLQWQMNHGRAVEKKRVFLATDDPALFEEAKKKYPEYEIIGNRQSAETAQLNSRYTDASLHGIIADIYFLSLCDYLVCTFSSQVCRIAYEMMQTFHADASSWFHSLDDVYYFGGQEAHEQDVVYAHKAVGDGELTLEVGDVIGVAGNHWDGYSKGRSRHTGQLGLYPSYKVKEKWRVVKF